MIGRGTQALLYNFEYHTGTKIAKETVKNTLEHLEQLTKDLKEKRISIKLTDNEINEQLKELEKEKEDFSKLLEDNYSENAHRRGRPIISPRLFPKNEVPFQLPPVMTAGIIIAVVWLILRK